MRIKEIIIIIIMIIMSKGETTIKVSLELTSRVNLGR